ncbi:MAG: hypothetical protein ABSD74_14105 [Rhizomicrobium sp.]|jgi:hypothetical protein
MFRYVLFSTTALVVAGAVSLAAADDKAANKRHALPPGVIAASSINGVPTTLIFESKRQNGPLNSRKIAPVEDPGKATAFSNLSKDRNAEFLSWYGFSVSAYSYSSESGSFYIYSSGYMQMAIPIVGRGQPVTTIKVPIAGASDFTIGLYTNGSVSGVNNVPLTQIVSGKGQGAEFSGYCCGQIVTVTIPPTTLNKGTTYWIVESAIKHEREKTGVGWLGEDTDYTGDVRPLMRYHKFENYDGDIKINYTSPWEAPGNGNWTEPAAEVE